MSRKLELKTAKPRLAAARSLADPRFAKRVVPDRRRKLLAREVRKTVRENMDRRRRTTSLHVLPVLLLQNRMPV